MLRAALACFVLVLTGAAQAECALTETALSGTVVDGKGNPVADAVVEGVWDERDAPGVMGRTKTGAWRNTFGRRPPCCSACDMGG